jgi:hypothetical protein
MSGIPMGRTEGAAWRVQLDGMVAVLQARSDAMAEAGDAAGLRLYALLTEAQQAARQIETGRSGVSLVKH